MTYDAAQKVSGELSLRIDIVHVKGILCQVPRIAWRRGEELPC